MCIPGVLHLHYIYEDYSFFFPFLCDLLYSAFVSYQDVSPLRLPMTYEYIFIQCWQWSDIGQRALPRNQNMV